MTTTEVIDQQASTHRSHLMDVDAHEMIPTHFWGEVFGTTGERFLQLATNTSMFEAGKTENCSLRDDLTADDSEINEERVWGVRGPDAPSAIDLRRRPEVLDTMGIDRQLIFPTFALWGWHLALNPGAAVAFGFDPAAVVDGQELGRAILRAHNEWCIGLTSELGSNRVRPVGALLAESIPQMMSDLEWLFSSGIKGVMFPDGVPPAGLSPAHPSLDPVWALCAEANVPLLIHVGTAFPFMASHAWEADVAVFEPSRNSSIEFPVQPYTGVTMNFSAENFLTTMIMGGVFERHPMLRFGVIELGAQWIGPFAERLDLWASQFERRFVGVIKDKPSEYVNRNVRVGPFCFEPIDEYIERYPQLHNVYCFNTDYPHREGGKRILQPQIDRLRPLGQDVMDAFFTGNGKWLLPD